ncbi:MAG: RimK-like ATPgrasp N-terminal domain-containing protein, partial [Oscillospiraceae bacterium]
MCGIVGFTGKADAAPILLDGLERLEYRGYDSAGIAIGREDEIEVVKSMGRLAVLREKCENGAAVPGCVGIGHTRWATHGRPSDVNSHPHVSENGRIAIVHNGIIENYLSLKEMLIRRGRVFTSETDTEVAAQLIDFYYEGNILEAVAKAAHELEGSYALGVICADTPGTLVAVKSHAPLIVAYGAEKWNLSIPGVEIITPRRYITDPRYASTPGTRVLNLSRSYRYQSNGYYVSLLAAA